MWTDAFQVCIMYLGIILILLLGSYKQEGGFMAAWRLADRRGRIEFDNIDPHPYERHTVWSVTIGGFFTWLAVYGVNQAQVQRCLSSPSLGKAQLALWMNAPGLFSFVVLSSLLGILIYARYADCDPLLANIITAKDQLLPLYVMDVLSSYPGLAGLFISCVFCGSLSTISSGLNSLSAVIVQDFVLVYFDPEMSEASAASFSKALVALFGVVVMALTWVASLMGGILSAALALFGAIGGPLLGIFTLGLFVPFANSIGAICGILTGLFVSFWITVGAQMFKPPSTQFCQSTTRCSDFTKDIHFNLSAVPYVTCVRPRVLVPADVEYDGLGIYRISYLWYSLLSVVVVMTVGVVVTLLTGKRRWASPSRRFVHPIVRRFINQYEPSQASASPRARGSIENTGEATQATVEAVRRKEEQERIAKLERGQRSNPGFEYDMNIMGSNRVNNNEETGRVNEEK